MICYIQTHTHTHIGWKKIQYIYYYIKHKNPKLGLYKLGHLKQVKHKTK